VVWTARRMSGRTTWPACCKSWLRPVTWRANSTRSAASPSPSAAACAPAPARLAASGRCQTGSQRACRTKYRRMEVSTERHSAVLITDANKARWSTGNEEHDAGRDERCAACAAAEEGRSAAGTGCCTSAYTSPSSSVSLATAWAAAAKAVGGGLGSRGEERPSTGDSEEERPAGSPPEPLPTGGPAALDGEAPSDEGGAARGATADERCARRPSALSTGGKVSFRAADARADMSAGLAPADDRALVARIAAARRGRRLPSPASVGASPMRRWSRRGGLGPPAAAVLSSNRGGSGALEPSGASPPPDGLEAMTITASAAARPW